MNSKSVIADLKAGLVVFLVALPLCLGIALAQNVPLFSGILSGIIGGIVVAMISGSKLSVSGPAAGLTSIVITSQSELGSFENFLLALFIAGLFQIVFGIIKAGIIGYYFPTAVIKGMLAAIGIILILKQIPHFVGYDKDSEGDETFVQIDGQNSFSELENMFHSISPGSVLVGLISIAILIFWKNKYFPKFNLVKQIPAPLIVVIVALAVSTILRFYLPFIRVNDEHLVVLPEFHSLQDILDTLIHPNFKAYTNSKIYEIAFIIAVVSSIETLLSIEAVDKLDPDKQISPTNRELIAQGCGNMVSGLIGGVPVTSVIVRSSVNISSGGKTQLSSIFHGVLLLFIVLLIPGVLQLIPLSALAALLILTGLNLTKPSLYKNLFKQGWDQFLPFIVTIVVMLFSDLLIGVMAGLVVSVIFILKQNYKSPYKLIRDEIKGEVNYFIKLSPHVTFINKGKFIAEFNKIPKNAIVYLDGGRSTFIDKDVLEIISSFKKSAHLKNIKVHLEAIEEVEIFDEH